jgi:hypothetical protein
LIWVSVVKYLELGIGWRTIVSCGRVAHGGAILVFLNTVLGLRGLLELLAKIEVNVVNVDDGVDNVDTLANVDDSLEEEVVVRNSS